MQVTPNYARIPEELRRYRQWCVWRYEDRQGPKPTKVPYNPVTATLVSVTDQTTWCDFDAVVTAATSQGTSYDGIGFVLTKDDPYAFVDLDQTSKDIDTQRQIKVFQEMDSYSERSPSGTGLHIVIKGDLPQGRRRSSIEIYSSGRYMTMTGDVFHDRPIIDRQDILTTLWLEMGGGAAAHMYNGDTPATCSDEEVLTKALNAANGVKFRELLEGRWQGIYASQSEADFAFIDIIAFYTQNRDQITRLFLASPLGQRDKAKRVDYVARMIYRAFDNMLPPIDFVGLHDKKAILMETLQQKAEVKQQSERLRQEAQTSADDNFVAKLREFWTPQDIEPPEGLMGDIARYIFASAPRPVAEVAIIAAIGLMAGVCGRVYNVSGTGLNMYLLLLAKSGIGKEQINNGIATLIAAVSKVVPTGASVPCAENFIGPAEIASGQALLKHLSDANKRSFVSVVGEFGLKLQQFANSRASTSDIMLKRVLLDLYNKSGKNNVLGASAYAQKENNTAAIARPAVSVVGESTPSTFYAALDEQLISDGLLPRFLLLEHKGIRPPRNRQHEKTVPTLDLITRLATLIDYSLKMQREERVIDVGCTVDALEYLDRLDELVDDLINSTEADSLRELWNRAHIKTLKLAALVAVGVNMTNPVITLSMAQWAYNVVSADILTLANKFSAGEIGKSSDENKQSSAILRACVYFVTEDFDKVKSYAVSRDMHQALIIPHSYIARKTNSLAVFRNAKNGPTRAIHDAIKGLCDTGDLQEVGKGQLLTKFGYSGRAYTIGKPENVAAVLD